MSIIKRQDTTSISESVEKMEALMVGVKIDIATVEDYRSSMVGPKI